MAHSAEYIADYLISKANPDQGGELLSNMKLQKLLYYCQGFYFAKYGKKLFQEPIHSWQYGPVVQDVYHKYKNFGASGIPNFEAPREFEQLCVQEQEMIDDVFDYFGQFSAIKLMNMTHAESPWKNTPSTEEITVDKLENHFKEFLVKK